MSQSMNFQFRNFMLVFVRCLRLSVYGRITTQKGTVFNHSHSVASTLTT